ncbi:MAG: hypothetical protein COA58_04535 [Bacteroidetes bacterium]|nr:MAG: hypothetical protein COA58_04535 [Bacteroidota bacterium]
MRKSKLLFTYLFLSICIFGYGQTEYEEYEFEEVDGSLETEYETEEIDAAIESIEIEESKKHDYNNDLVYSTSSSPYLNADTSLKSRYKDDAYLYVDSDSKKGKEADKKKNENGKGDVNHDRSSGRSHAPGPGFGILATIIFYCFLALAIGLIIYLIFQAVVNLRIQKKPRLKRVDPHVEIEHDIEKIEALDPNDLRQLIKKAKEAGNFTLATRFYFLLYLEQLENKKAIKYHRDKTNADYLSELKSENNISQFIKLSYLFEYVWYGKKALDQTSFENLETIFHQQIATTE